MHLIGARSTAADGAMYQKSRVLRKGKADLGPLLSANDACKYRS